MCSFILAQYHFYAMITVVSDGPMEVYRCFVIQLELCSVLVLCESGTVHQSVVRSDCGKENCA
jgi:hypothetical protein